MKKLIRLLTNKINFLLHRRKISKQVKKTEKLRGDKHTDYDRWNKREQLFEDWNERTKLLASMIEPGSRIIEFGAGNMELKCHLPEGCEYTPTDIVKRNSDFVECDLNEEIYFDLSVYDTAVFGGVLEYVYDLDFVFKQLSNHVQKVLLSYSCLDISNANRLENGWLSDYSKEQLENIFKRNNYEIVDYREWRNQSLFSLKKFGDF